MATLSKNGQRRVPGPSRGNAAPRAGGPTAVTGAVRRSPAVVARLVQLALDDRAQVRAEITRLTSATTVSNAVVTALWARVRLRRRILRLRARRAALVRRYVRTFPNGDCGFWGITQSGFTARDSRLIDRMLRLRRQVATRYRDSVPFHNVRLAIVDPLGLNPGLEDTVRLAETRISFEHGLELHVRTRWRRTRGFPRLPQVRPSERLVYEFVAVTVPTDIAANNVAAARTARSAVRSNQRMFDPRFDAARITRVDSIDAFIRWFTGLDRTARARNARVRQLEVFSHGGLDGPMFGLRRLQFDFSGATSRGARPLSSLPTLPYTGDAVVFFRGCRIGRGSFLRAFAQRQGVATYGFEGTTSFSTRPRSFQAWEHGTPAYQLDFPGSETWSHLVGRHPRATPPVGYVPEREVGLQRSIDGHRVGTRTSGIIVDRVATEQGERPDTGPARGICGAPGTGPTPLARRDTDARSVDSPDAPTRRSQTDALMFQRTRLGPRGHQMIPLRAASPQRRTCPIRSTPAESILLMQRIVGNQAIQRSLQSNGRQPAARSSNLLQLRRARPARRHSPVPGVSSKGLSTFLNDLNQTITQTFHKRSTLSINDFSFLSPVQFLRPTKKYASADYHQAYSQAATVCRAKSSAQFGKLCRNNKACQAKIRQIQGNRKLCIGRRPTDALTAAFLTVRGLTLPRGGRSLINLGLPGTPKDEILEAIVHEGLHRLRGKIWAQRTRIGSGAYHSRKRVRLPHIRSRLDEGTVQILTRIVIKKMQGLQGRHWFRGYSTSSYAREVAYVEGILKRHGKNKAFLIKAYFTDTGIREVEDLQLWQ